jgi:hypothetical protein
MISTYAFKDLMALPQSLHFRGVCPQFGIFTINFLDENGVNLLHFSFRIDPSALVINENQSGQWGAELTVEGVEFPKGRPFLLRIDLDSGNRVRVSLEERVLQDFTWRTDVRQATRVDITDVEFALFREGGPFKAMPEDSSATARAEALAQPADAGLAALAERLDGLTVAIAELQKQTRAIAVSLQALNARETSVRPTARASSGKAA